MKDERKAQANMERKKEWVDTKETLNVKLERKERFTERENEVGSKEESVRQKETEKLV